MKNKRGEELRAKIDEAVRRYEQFQSELRDLTDTPSPGDLFLFNLRIEIPLEWAAIFTHPDDESLWFVVPADQNPLVGTADVEIPDTAKCGPLTLRCGRGLWVHVDDFDYQARSGRLEIDYVEQVRDKLAQLVRGQMTPSRLQEECDLDLDYEHWLSEVSRAVDQLEKQLQCELESDAIVLKASEFNLNWQNSLRHGKSVEKPMSLAADTGGLLATPEAAKNPPQGTRLDQIGPGDLVVLSYPQGVVSQYFPRGDEEPPDLYLKDPAKDSTTIPWNETPSGSYLAGQLFPWQDGQVVLWVGQKPAYQITVEQ